MKRLLFVVGSVSVVLTSLAIPLTVSAQTPTSSCVSYQNAGLFSGTMLKFDGNLTHFTLAKDNWQGCRNIGFTGFPEVKPGTGGIQIKHQTGTGPGGSCGQFDPLSNTITIWKKGITAGNPGKTYFCDRASTLTHEIGHVLELADQFGQACEGHLMAAAVVAHVGGAYWAGPRFPQEDECHSVDKKWNVGAGDPFVGDGGSGGDGGGCVPPPFGTLPEKLLAPCETPILLDIGGRLGIQTTGLDNTVRFDLNVDGHEEAITWSAPGRGQAFLALDLNHNGQVDDGGELFGDGTFVSEGIQAEHGFEALSQYDLPDNGGNADGLLNADDAVWSRLRIWSDANHDAITQVREMRPLASQDIVGLELTYFETKDLDEHGNWHRFRGYFHKRTKVRGQWAITRELMEDVLFQTGR